MPMILLSYQNHPLIYKLHLTCMPLNVKFGHLTLIARKPKFYFFSKVRLPNNVFTIDGVSLEVVKEYKYIGVLFSRGGSFLPKKKHIAKQATKAMFSLLKKSQIIIITH